ncbi:hypothetical protein EJ08DRAFT_668209 [Tothia fuscella]|uniref:Zn(2)-C6 fungal-type domain-containing protein n=1 Tax=Tothia fuscella TaxID=1048955 RepID=A0A9P4NZZ2_9PEZI|nr:hypothetical protein EJ08DRAFT_668209 [Tothia fuscella]
MTEESSLILRSPSIHSSDNPNRIQKASTTAQLNGNGAGGLNPRSCVTCRRRKVKCDKKPVCTNCVKAHIECVYPSPGRAPRRPRKPADMELIDRLKKLEGVVQMLGSQVQPENEKAETQEALEAGKEAPETHEQKIARACKELKELKKQKREQEGGRKPSTTSTGLENRFGRLVVDEGRSRYINPSFWASLSGEVEDIKGILHDSDDEHEDYPSPETSHSSPSNYQGFIFGLSSQNVDMLALHPPADHVPIYWRLYKENVDPLVKVIHAPSIEPTILEAKDCLDRIHRGLEALMFALYYGTITSLSAEECRATFGEERNDLINRYLFGVQQALARADFLQTDEIIVVQAFVIFLICLRRNGDARIIWTLTGLLVRMGQTLGLHRDGSHFDLPPFQVEMRRRLWWQICILDSRASEDHGCDPTIIEATFDTKMPLNVNDIDLDPLMTNFPESRLGCTEMTFGLIRFEIAATLRRLQYTPPGPKRCNKFFAEMSVEKKENWIKECHQRLEDKYLKDCDMSVPLYWVIATVSRLIMSKMWLMAYHPFQRLDGGSSLPQEIKDRLFVTSLNNVEYSLLLESEERTKKWGWLFRTYVQWHAIAFLLSELCVRVEGDEVERAWKTIDFVVARRWVDDQQISHKLKGHLWKPLRRLMEKARAEREKALAAKQEQQNATHDEASQASASMSTFDPTIQILNMDFTADRLYPINEITNDTSTNWIDPRRNSNIFAAPTTTIGTTSTNIPTSTINQDGVLGASLPEQFDFRDEWILNGDAHLVTPILTNPVATSNVTTYPNYTSPMTFTTTLPPLAPTTSSLMDNNTASPLLADGSVNWANWDDMVQEFGMDLDVNLPGNISAPGHFGNTFGGFGQWY